jgi:hypothetical protein
MGYLQIELAHTIVEDRLSEAERCRRINAARTVREKQFKSPVQTLVRLLHSVMQREQYVATEPAG